MPDLRWNTGAYYSYKGTNKLVGTDAKKIPKGVERDPCRQVAPREPLWTARRQFENGLI
jgi:hypothetical protein